MEIICLANSYKNHGRCIAGIDLETGNWIRPVSDFDDGHIPLNNHRIMAEKIRILDVLKIPINDQISGHEIENFHYHSSGSWQVVRRAEVTDILRFREQTLLYPDFQKSIPFSYFEERSPVKTLQLIEVKQLEYFQDNRQKWRAIIHDSYYNIRDCYFSITDPFILESLNDGKNISNHCLITMSFGQPWQVYDKCYRLIAGIIQLPPNLDLILTEMKRIGWEETQGRKYLTETFAKRSRYELTVDECEQFLDHLKTLPDV